MYIHTKAFAERLQRRRRALQQYRRVQGQRRRAQGRSPPPIYVLSAPIDVTHVSLFGFCSFHLLICYLILHLLL
jgi:hypothetical protein